MGAVLRGIEHDDAVRAARLAHDAVKLVPEALDVIQRVDNHSVAPIASALNCSFQPPTADFFRESVCKRTGRLRRRLQVAAACHMANSTSAL